MVYRYKPPSILTRLKWWLEDIKKLKRAKNRRYIRKTFSKPHMRAWAIIILCSMGAISTYYFDQVPRASASVIYCSYPYVIDGDTFSCGGMRIRLEGIDTPELPGHCKKGRECTPGDPYAARAELVRLTRSSVACTQSDIDHYGRIIGRCEANGKDISCSLLDSGHAVRRYGHIWC